MLLRARSPRGFARRRGAHPHPDVQNLPSGSARSAPRSVGAGGAGGPDVSGYAMHAIRQLSCQRQFGVKVGA